MWPPRPCGRHVLEDGLNDVRLGERIVFAELEVSLLFVTRSFDSTRFVATVRQMSWMVQGSSGAPRRSAMRRTSNFFGLAPSHEALASVPQGIAAFACAALEQRQGRLAQRHGVGDVVLCSLRPAWPPAASSPRRPRSFQASRGLGPRRLSCGWRAECQRPIFAPASCGAAACRRCT